MYTISVFLAVVLIVIGLWDMMKAISTIPIGTLLLIVLALMILGEWQEGCSKPSKDAKGSMTTGKRK